MRLLDKRAMEESVSIKSIEKDAFTGKKDKARKNRNAGAVHRPPSFKSCAPSARVLIPH